MNLLAEKKKERKEERRGKKHLKRRERNSLVTIAYPHHLSIILLGSG